MTWMKFYNCTILLWGTAVAQWLRRCAKNRKVARSISDGVIGIFHWRNPSDRTVALGSAQSLKKWVPEALSGGKGGRCVRLTTLPPSCAVVMKSGYLNLLTPNDVYSGRTAPLTSKRFILYIYITNKGTEYFKHGIYSPFLSLQNAVCFIILTYLVPVLFTFYIQSVLKFKK